MSIMLSFGGGGPFRYQSISPHSMTCKLVRFGIEALMSLLVRGVLSGGSRGDEGNTCPAQAP